MIKHYPIDLEKIFTCKKTHPERIYKHGYMKNMSKWVQFEDLQILNNIHDIGIKNLSPIWLNMEYVKI